MNVNWVLRKDGEIYPEPFDSKQAEQYIIGNYKAVTASTLQLHKSTMPCKECNTQKQNKTITVVKSCADVAKEVLVDSTTKTEQCAVNLTSADKSEIYRVSVMRFINNEKKPNKVFVMFMKYVAKHELTANIVRLQVLSLLVGLILNIVYKHANFGGLIVGTMTLFVVLGVCVHLLLNNILYGSFGLKLYGLNINEFCYVIDFVNNRVVSAKVLKLSYAKFEPNKALFECEVYDMRCTVSGYDLYKTVNDAQAVLRAVQTVNAMAFNEKQDSISKDSQFMLYYKEILRTYYSNQNTYGFGFERETPAVLTPIIVNGIKYKPMDVCNCDRLLYAYNNNRRQRFKKEFIANLK